MRACVCVEPGPHRVAVVALLHLDLERRLLVVAALALPQPNLLPPRGGRAGWPTSPRPPGDGHGPAYARRAALPPRRFAASARPPAGKPANSRQTVLGMTAQPSTGAAPPDPGRFVTSKSHSLSLPLFFFISLSLFFFLARCVGGRADPPPPPPLSLSFSLSLPLDL